MKSSSKIKEKTTTSPVDTGISIILASIITLLALFEVVTSGNPEWLLDISNQNKRYEVKSIINNGIIQSQKNNEKAAIEIFDKALSIMPDLAEIKVNLAVSYRKLGNYKKSEQLLKEALDGVLMFKHIAYDNLTDIYLHTGNDSLLTIAFNQAFLSNPFMIDKYIKKGNFFLNKSLWDSALAAYNTAYELRKHIKTYYFDMLHTGLSQYANMSDVSDDIKEILGSALQIDSSKYDRESIDYFISRDKGLAINLNKIGFVLAKKDSLEKSLQYFDSAMKIFPDYPDARTNYNFVKAEINKRKSNSGSK